MLMDSLSQANDARSVVRTRQRVSQLLGANPINPFIRLNSEELRHPWSVNEHQRLDFPLLRIWDMNSGSQPDEETGNRMLSTSPNQPLDTRKGRIDSLENHLDHSIWEPTTYISFNKSASAIERLARNRINRGWGAQKLIVIDPAVRLKKGLPVLDVAAEMNYYGILDPYNGRGQYHIDHYVCLWAVSEEEVVGRYDDWDWEELANTTNWYEEIIMPAFRDFRGEMEPEPTPTHASTFDMSTMMESLPRKSLNYTQTFTQLKS